MKYYGFLLLFLLFTGCKTDPKNQEEEYRIPSHNTAKTMSAEDQSIARGKKVYADFCLRCHMPEGQGVPNIYPPLASTNWLTEKRKESLHAVKYGLNGEIEVNGKTYDNVMLPMGLSDREIADVMNYVMTSFGNTQENPVTEKEVSEITE